MVLLLFNDGKNAFIRLLVLLGWKIAVGGDSERVN
jgi:hypothetical protein